MRIIVEMSYLKDEHFNQLQKSFSHHQFVKELDDPNAEALISMPKFINKNILDHLPQLKWIFLLTAGYDTIDLAYLKNRGIKMYHAKDVFSIQIAEDTIGKIIYFNRHFSLYQKHMKEGLWKFHGVSYEIAESTIGIIGTGSIGMELAKRLKAFDARLLGFRKQRVSLPFFDEMYYDEQGLRTLIMESDYIILSLPLNEDTFHFFDMKKLKLMKKEAVLINVARGDIVDQEALVEVLKQQIIRGALLDVTSPEPLPKHHELWKLDQVFITPHQASASPHVECRLMNVLIHTLHLLDEHKLTLNQVI